MLRVDQDIESPALELPDNLDSYDAVIISDYNKGSITLDLVKRIRAGYNGPIFIDTKIRDLAQLHGCIVKINEREYTARISDHDNVIVTRGELGVSYADQHYAAPMVDARDVCGAGDTFLAGLVAGYLLQHDIESAIKIALSASAEAVRHVGTHSLTIQDAVAICESL
jgi:D-beta-D-heptose 7-phosphate kinase/D-beta-D-heptose 1-phosphate adenosyltransferase